MQLKEVFDMYFAGELSYEELKDCIRERNDHQDASQILDIMDAVEAYYRKWMREVA